MLPINIAIVGTIAKEETHGQIIEYFYFLGYSLNKYRGRSRVWKTGAAITFKQFAGFDIRNCFFFFLERSKRRNPKIEIIFVLFEVEMLKSL